MTQPHTNSTKRAFILCVIIFALLLCILTSAKYFSALICTEPALLLLKEEEEEPEKKHFTACPQLQHGEDLLSAESDEASGKDFEIIEAPLSMDKDLTPVRDACR